MVSSAATNEISWFKLRAEDGPACPAEELIPKIFQRVFAARRGGRNDMFRCFDGAMTKLGSAVMDVGFQCYLGWYRRVPKKEFKLVCN